MELISLQALCLLLLAVLAVKLLPRQGADVVLAALTVYVLYISNTALNFVLTLLILTAVYFAALFIQRGKKWVSTLAVVLLAAGLVIWKYANFFTGSINYITNLLVHREFLPTFSFTAPFGISYGFLILIAYVLGVYWGLVQPRRSYFAYLHTVAFFPLWVMGPILGTEDLGREEALHVSRDSIWRGGLRILWGVFEKLVISQRCAVIVDAIYADTVSYGGMYIFVAALLFVLQLYTEFSGAMHIVLGGAEMLGKRLPENFDRPFASTSVSEFWRRWHITLGAWLRNFILYPVLKSRAFLAMGKRLKARFGKKASKKITTYLGLFLSWFLIGLWHGGGWNYIFGSGIYYWLLIVGGELAKPLFDRACARLKIRRDSRGYRLFAQGRTTLLFSFGLIFFRAGSIAAAVEALGAMLSCWNPWILVDGSLLSLGLEAADFVVLALGMAVLYAVSRVQKNGAFRDFLARKSPLLRWAVAYALIVTILVFGCYGQGYDGSTFIYQQF